MAKINGVEMEVIGWYQPHALGSKMTECDNLVANPKAGIVDKVTGAVEPARILMPSMAKQSFKDECDINNIVKKFEATQQIDHINQAHAKGLFVDLPEAFDYQAGLNMVMAGQEAFQALPAHVRSRFGNDPANFLEFFNDPANQEEMISLGLATDSRPPAASKPDAPVSPPAGGTEGGENPSKSS